MKVTNRNINLEQGHLIAVDATADGEPDTLKAHYGATVTENGRLQFVWPDCVPAGGANVTIHALGYKPWSGRTFVPVNGAYEDPQPGIELEPSAIPFPSAPSRETICQSTLSFQGLDILTPTFGLLHWFEVLSWSLPQLDRMAIYLAKHDAGDTAAIVDLSAQYCGPTYCYPVPGRDWSRDLYRFRARICEIIRAGFPNIWLFLAGDGMSNPAGGYNDPVGWTYGFEWLMDHLAEVITSLQPLPGALLGSDDAIDLTKYILFCPGYDAVFYGWTDADQRVAEFGRYFRTLLPDGYLAIEHDIGHIPIGNGPSDWAPGGAMQNFDVVFSEFDNQPTPDNDSYWQVAARLLGPAYIRPADQPPDDDPPPAPFYLLHPTPRGPVYAHALEYWAYPFVRGAVTAAEVQDKRRLMRGLGYALVD